jgi:ABC-type transport system substrate-binding protein
MFASQQDVRRSGRGKALRWRLQPTRRTATMFTIAAVVVTFGMAGCSTSSTSHTANSSGPHRGGSVTEMTQAYVPSIDPAFDSIATSTEYDQAPLEVVYGPGLVYLNPDTSAVEMGFASSLTTTDNGGVWTLVLHPGLKFSDGTAFNAAAVADDIARLANPKTGSVFQASAAQLTTKVLGPTTLQITCTPRDALFPVIMSQDFAMIPSPTAVAKEGTKFGAHPVGPGPFKVQSTAYGLSWTFVRNGYYSLFAPGQPYLNSVKILLGSSTQQVTSALQTGEAQTTDALDAQYAKDEEGIGMKVVTPPQPAIAFLGFNESKPPFNNVLAREAVYDALNRATMTSIWAAGTQVSTNLFTPGSPFYSTSYNFPSQNSAKAQQLFNQLAAEGHPVKFAVNWPECSCTGDVASYVQGVLSQYKNVTVTNGLVPQNEYTQIQTSSGFTSSGYQLSSVIPGIFTTLETGGSTNYGKFSDAKLDAALLAIESTTNVAQQKPEWDIVQQELNTQYPGVWGGRNIQGYAWNSQVVGGVSLTEYGQIAFFGPMYQK